MKYNLPYNNHYLVHGVVWTLKRSIEDIKSLIQELKKILIELYGEDLPKIILFGSFARSDASSDSDIDIAVVLKGNVDKFQELDRLHDAV